MRIQSLLKYLTTAWTTPYLRVRWVSLRLWIFGTKMTAMPESPVSVDVTTELSAVMDAIFVFPVVVNGTTELLR